jgi:hypothetical protein
MKKRRHVPGWMAGVVAALAAAAVSAQTLDFLSGEAALGPIVRGAPYSGDAQTAIVQTLGDGTRIERTITAKFYRDAAGRVRREQTIAGLAALNPLSSSKLVVTIVDPVAGVSYVLDPATRKAVRTPLDRRLIAGPPPPPPAPPAPGGNATRAAPPPPPPPPRRPTEENLGSRRIAGLEAVGRKTTLTVPAGEIGNDRPIAVTDERWVAPDLQLVVLSRHHDPRIGDIEFRLENVRRAEPPLELFAVPSDYTVVDAPPPPPPAPPKGRN